MFTCRWQNGERSLTWSPKARDRPPYCFRQDSEIDRVNGFSIWTLAGSFTVLVWQSAAYILSSKYAFSTTLQGLKASSLSKFCTDHHDKDDQRYKAEEEKEIELLLPEKLPQPETGSEMCVKILPVVIHHRADDDNGSHKDDQADTEVELLIAFKQCCKFIHSVHAAKLGFSEEKGWIFHAQMCCIPTK